MNIGVLLNFFGKRYVDIGEIASGSCDSPTPRTHIGCDVNEAQVRRPRSFVVSTEEILSHA
jgi:hypothetical protein